MRIGNGTIGIGRDEKQMKVLDIFSWVSEKEISLEQLEQIFMDYKSGVSHKGWNVLLELPKDAAENVLNCKKELQEEGKQAAFIVKDENVIAVIGYWE